LKQWADNGWLKPHRTSRKEISSLLRITERDLNDAHGDISSDWRFVKEFKDEVIAWLNKNHPELL
jgi:hypothetical protein